MRTLSAMEKGAAMALANAVGSDAERNQLLSDLESCSVEDVLTDGTRLVFHIPDYQRPLYRGQDTFRGKDRLPVEGTILDKDGGEMDVLLFLDQNNRVLELELVKHNGEPVAGPNWHSFRLNRSPDADTATRGET